MFDHEVTNKRAYIKRPDAYHEFQTHDIDVGEVVDRKDECGLLSSLTKVVLQAYHNTLPIYGQTIASLNVISYTPAL
jgi:hypothetical protein